MLSKGLATQVNHVVVVVVARQLPVIGLCQQTIFLLHPETIYRVTNDLGTWGKLGEFILGCCRPSSPSKAAANEALDFFGRPFGTGLLLACLVPFPLHTA